jgi:hypothetical protein
MVNICDILSYISYINIFLPLRKCPQPAMCECGGGGDSPPIESVNPPPATLSSPPISDVPRLSPLSLSPSPRTNNVPAVSLVFLSANQRCPCC